MKFMLRITAACAILAAGLMFPTKAGAQNPPAGAIWDLMTVHPTVLSSYVQFNTSFVADNASEYVSFAFRETPAYFAFDDASVTQMGSSTNLLADPGFESASSGQNCNHNNALGCPSGWLAWIQPVDLSAIGQVATNTSPYGCPPNAAHAGTNFWCDGSVEGYDAVYQQLTGLSVGATYNVSFWLGDNSGSPPNQSSVGSQIDMLVYAGDQLPTGTIPIGTPEPASFALLGIGIGLAGLVMRRKRQAS